MARDRIARLNSLLKEVISETIRREVRNPHASSLITVTGVEITKDLHYAKVFISVIGSAEEKAQSIKALQSAAGFIAVNASKKVTLRYFPTLTFFLDSSVEQYAKIDEILYKIHNEKQTRQSPPENV